MDGSTFWPQPINVALDQQEHAEWKGKSAPTNLQGLGITCDRKKDDNNNSIENMLASNYYACLSPPPFQVKEHEQNTKRVAFKTTIEISPSTPPESRNKNQGTMGSVSPKKKRERTRQQHK